MENFDNRRRVVFVGNIPFQASEEEITKKCKEIGPVVSFRLMSDQAGKPKGYGFCEYRDEETAMSAIRNLNGEDLRGRKLRVNFANNDKNSDRNRENMSRSNSNNNQDQDQIGIASDLLTQYLVKIPRDKLIEIVADFKKLAAENSEQARELLLACPVLPKAIHQAQMILGIVPNTDAAAAIPQFAAQSKSLDQCQVRVESVNSTQSLDSFLSKDDHPLPKRAKLNDGRAVYSSTDERSQDSFMNGGGYNTSSSTMDEGSAGENRDGKMMKFSPEQEAYMLQQVKNLTREQISSLPPEEQQQVIQLQQMLIQQAY